MMNDKYITKDYRLTILGYETFVIRFMKEHCIYNEFLHELKRFKNKRSDGYKFQNIRSVITEIIMPVNRYNFHSRFFTCCLAFNETKKGPTYWYKYSSLFNKEYIALFNYLLILRNNKNDRQRGV